MAAGHEAGFPRPLPQSREHHAAFGRDGEIFEFGRARLKDENAGLHDHATVAVNQRTQAGMVNGGAIPEEFPLWGRPADVAVLLGSSALTVLLLWAFFAEGGNCDWCG